MLKKIAARAFLSLIFFNQLIPFSSSSKAGLGNLQTLGKEKIFLSFNDLEKIILENNLQLQNAKEDIKNASYSLEASLSKYGLQVSLDSSIPQYTNGNDSIPGGELETSLLNTNATLTLNLPIFDPKKYPEIKSTKNKLTLAENAFEILKDDLNQEVSRRFFELQNANQELINGTRSVNSSLLSLENAKSKFNNGIGNKLDLLDAKAQLARDKQFLLDKKNSYQISKNALLQILNLDKEIEISQRIEILGWWDHDLDKTLLSTLQNRKRLKNILIKKSIEDLEAEFALADSRPSFFLSNQLTRSYSSGESQVTNVDSDSFSSSFENTVALKLNWNIFDSGLSRSNYKIKKSKAQKEIINYDLQKTLIIEEVKNVFESLKSSKEKVYISKSELEASTEALKLSRLRFDNGISSQGEVIDAQKDLTAARSRFALNISRYNTNLQKIQNISKLDYSGICKNSNNNLYDLNDICSVDEPNENSQYEI
tara:strand:- start:242 stop:1690 length:1449 start_codon:yes stop_codon:yes gene_type:complete